MKKLSFLLIVLSFILIFPGCAKSDNDSPTIETEPKNEVIAYLSDKYDMEFRLYCASDQDLYVFYIYPDHAERECHILMPENTDDIAENIKELSWEIVDDELIITGAYQGTFQIDISAETATDTETGRVYTICEMQ